MVALPNLMYATLSKRFYSHPTAAGNAIFVTMSGFASDCIVRAIVQVHLDEDSTLTDVGSADSVCCRSAQPMSRFAVPISQAL